MRPVEKWILDEDLEKIYTAEYWNNIELEKKKAWWIAEGEYQNCRNYIKESGLLAEAEKAIELSRIRDSTGKCEVVDLAAGIGWFSALISRIPNVSEIHAVEISDHRIGILCEHAFKMLDGEAEKLHRYLGSFYETQLKTGSVDFIFLSQAFHHADNPLHLLVECDRLLKKGGKIVLIGEHFIDWKSVARRFFGEMARRRTITFRFFDLFEPDPLLGDHYYMVQHYQFLFSCMGYDCTYEYIPETKTAIYMGTKKP